MTQPSRYTLCTLALISAGIVATIPAHAQDSGVQLAPIVITGITPTPYCSSHEPTPDTTLTQVELPPELAISVDYGMTVLDSPRNAATRDAVYRLALYLMSPAAQSVLPRYGFTAVALQ